MAHPDDHDACARAAPQDRGFSPFGLDLLKYAIRSLQARHEAAALGIDERAVIRNEINRRDDYFRIHRAEVSRLAEASVLPPDGRASQTPYRPRRLGPQRSVAVCCGLLGWAGIPSFAGITGRHGL